MSFTLKIGTVPFGLILEHFTEVYFGVIFHKYQIQFLIQQEPFALSWHMDIFYKKINMALDSFDLSNCLYIIHLLVHAL